MTIQHTTLSGHEIAYDAADPPELGAFLEELRALVEDPATTEDAAIVLAYSPRNPLLGPHELFPDRGVVTKETLGHPAYAVVTDLLARKHISARGLSVEAMANEHTFSVAEAAKRLGVHESAIRQAVAARRLPSWLKDGRHYFSARALDAYKRGAQGPEPARPRGGRLGARIGSAEGLSFRVKGATFEDFVPKEGHVRGGHLVGWEQIAVLAGGEGSDRFFLLEPAPGAQERIEHGGFYVDGPFRIAKKMNNAEKARAAWKAIKSDPTAAE